VNKISQNDIEALIELFDRSDWRELRVTGDGIDLFVSKDPNARRSIERTSEVSAGVASSPVPVGPTPVVQPAAPAATRTRPPHWVAIRAPCLGTFYNAPKPGAPPFVSIGQPVSRETEVCLVEVMKLFTTVRAGVIGTIRELLVADSELVEFDQPLFYVEPDA
jgi:acetyl-CoA carboxylase biotin carboxyl carrier protein